MKIQLSPGGFNPSIGILVVQTEQFYCSECQETGFNPSIGILVVQTHLLDALRYIVAGFNPSIGILVVQTGDAARAGRADGRFQSLNRDSGCSDRTKSGPPS